jgi:hypothetical protein
VADPVDDAIVSGDRAERPGDRPRRGVQPAIEPEWRSAARRPAATGDGNGIEPAGVAPDVALSRPGGKAPTPQVAFTPTVSTRLPYEIEQPAAAESQTIHVTIGRVEIRAAAAPPLPRKASPRPPAMSLEQYLKQRRGASRE